MRQEIIFLESLLALLAVLHFLAPLLSASLGEFNAIEEQKEKLKEKEGESKSALELIQCAIQFGNPHQEKMGVLSY
jgi:hypothetical protein